jgi:pimeloyl-ACP methyl ester carboxylesterase
MTSSIDQPWEPAVGSDAGYALFAKEARVVADDGTPIAYTVRNPGGARVPVLFANGWSCSDAYWVDLLPDLEERGHPCILPDTRGHGRSGLPRSPGRGARNLTIDDVSMVRIARDLVAVLDDSGFDRVLVVGHSMGVQTGLEVYRQIPERIAGLVLLAGTYENPTKTFYGTSIGDHLFPVLGATMRWLPEIVKPVQATIGPASVGHFGARLAKAAGPKATAAQLHPYLLHLKSVDLAVVMLMAGAMRAHSAADLLAEITVPTLIVAAGSDVFTPARCSEAMHHRIAASELITFPAAGHTLPVEEPEAITAAIDDFVARRLPRPTAKKRGSRTTTPGAKPVAPRSTTPR